MHNHSENTYKLLIGAEFVTIVFFYLASPDYKYTSNFPRELGHIRHLSGMEGEVEYIEWRNQHPWVTQEKFLYLTMSNSEEFKSYKDDFENEQEKFNGKLFIGKYKIELIFILLLILCCIVTLFLLLDISGILKNVIDRILIPVAVTLITSAALRSQKK